MNRRQIIHIDPSGAGRIQPQAPELEQAVIGAALMERDTLRELSGILDPEHFYVQAHATIWRLMLGLLNDGEAIDILTVTERAKATGDLDIIGGAFYISQLSNKVASGANAEYHARIIQQKFMQRRMIELGHRLTAIEESEDVFDTLDQANAMLAEVNAIPMTADPVSAAEIIAGIADENERPLFIHFGMGELDRHVCMGPKQVVVIGARPAVGKTTFALNACMNMARDGHRVLFVSLEMSARDLGSKVSGILTGIDSERITHGEISDDERLRIVQVNSTHGGWLSRLMVEDMSALRAAQVAGIVQRAVQRHGVSVVVIDYLQCVTGDGDSSVERMSNISRACKTAAKATGVRLIELSQLKRRDGADEDPEMSDLREAGQIEADGDIIIMLGRKKGEGEILAKIVKNKVGPIGNVILPFDLASQTIGARWQTPQPPPFNPRLPIHSPATPSPDNRIEPVREDAPF